ncbi:MAG TPA: PDZ domain-containing protein [Vicinamibacterales bacterium]
MGHYFVPPLIGAVVFLTGLTATPSAPQNFPRAPGPDSLILQGPGSDIRVSVSVLPESRRPQGLAGVVIEQVVRDGPADEAGLRRGDIVTEFDAVAITNPVQFGKVVRDTPPGRRVKAIVWRDGSRREIFITPVVTRPS